MKVCNTSDLLDLCRNARYEDFNRQVNVELLESIVDMEGKHVIECLLPYHNMDTASTPHHRCEVYIKTTNSDEPKRLMLDICVEQYDRLFNSEDYLANA